MKRLLLTSVAIAFATPAFAAFSFTDAAFYTAPADGTLTFIFEGHSAADTDVMKFVFDGSTIFDNHAVVGTTVSVAVTAGTLYQLQMVDLSVANTWSSDPGLNIDGMPHLAYTNSAGYSQYNLGASPPFAVDETTCAAGGCYLGWEDRAFPKADADYNDLVFAETFTPATPSPEPFSLSLLGVGLLGLAVVRYRRG